MQTPSSFRPSSFRPSSFRRRDALFAAGSFLTAAALQGCAAALGPLDPAPARRRAQEEDRRDEPEADLPPVVRALVLALHAPSAHNTQPWKLRLVSAHEALLYVDETRLLPETDPPARQIHMSCGCFAEAFALAATRFGFGARVDHFPEGPYAGAADVGRLPVARLALEGTSPADPLAAYIEARQTSRLPYEGPPVTGEVLAPVLAAARLRWVRPRLVSPEARPELERLVALAMEKEMTTRAKNEETRRWFRFDSDQEATRRDGFGFEHVGLTGLASTFASWSARDTAESWNDASTVGTALDTFRDALATTRAFAWLETASNGHVDHLETGRDAYRLLLALTRYGLFAHPVSQILQEYEAMRPLRERFEAFAGVREPAKVQMILRLGRSAAPPLTYRRHAEAFFMKKGAT